MAVVVAGLLDYLDGAVAAALDEARGGVERVFSGKYGDQAPRSKVAGPRSLSRRPYFWPFSLKSARRDWALLTGGF